jgi:hypothetical protein
MLTIGSRYANNMRMQESETAQKKEACVSPVQSPSLPSPSPELKKTKEVFLLCSKETVTYCTGMVGKVGSPRSFGGRRSDARFSPTSIARVDWRRCVSIGSHGSVAKFDQLN